MLQIDKNDLFEIEMDLDGMLNLLTVMESSEFYKGTGDSGVCRAIRNSLEHTKAKLNDVMSNAEEIPFKIQQTDVE